jgi:hypothetical protein
MPQAMCFGRSAIGKEAEKVSVMVRSGDERSTQDVYGVWEAEENGLSKAIQTPLGAAETGSRQTSAPTWATESFGQY